ncbi:SEC-C domain-containing protein [Parasporobacterium paucivorans]|uniref:SEC-C motif-containing protein n=1 Tax=Parasporobacterium paucivorans DSM 15970 TaxID=1122934 RepID=A0A1M6EB67_9FIRM|nr:SEC-C domain-containing protein [Parasporobacterium paucivorans]SHI82560.1 SEC-C motif-containing protein [Parasporobacterium paucivorans DSM 15970]
MNKLIKYIIALTNLYGLVHKNKVLEIYNSQNEDPITIEDVEAYLSKPTKDLGDSFIQIHKDYFVKEIILENKEFDLMLRKKADKPYYVPGEDELLNYVDELYFERNRQYTALLKFVEKNFFKEGDEKAEWLCDDIQGMCQFGVGMQTILDAFNQRQIHFKDQKQVSDVMNLIMDLLNNVRIWENNGHTPNEIHEKFEKPHLRPLPVKPFEFGGTDTRREKIGRNDPCPCGSGKKYKKCCGGK